MNWEKINEGVFVDMSQIGVVLIEAERRFDDETKKVNEVFSVIGILKFGQRLPVPLFEAPNFEDAERYVRMNFPERKH